MQRRDEENLIQMDEGRKQKKTLAQMEITDETQQLLVSSLAGRFGFQYRWNLLLDSEWTALEMFAFSSLMSVIVDRLLLSF